MFFVVGWCESVCCLWHPASHVCSAAFPQPGGVSGSSQITGGCRVFNTVNHPLCFALFSVNIGDEDPQCFVLASRVTRGHGSENRSFHVQCSDFMVDLMHLTATLPALLHNLRIATNKLLLQHKMTWFVNTRQTDFIMQHRTLHCTKHWNKFKT